MEIIVALIGAFATIAAAFISRAPNHTHERQDTENKGTTKPVRTSNASRIQWGFIWAVTGFFYAAIVTELAQGTYHPPLLGYMLYGAAPGAIGGLIYGQPTKDSISWVMGTVIGFIFFMYIFISSGTQSDTLGTSSVDQNQLWINGWMIGRAISF